jgi:hypothetical protein
MTDFRGAHRPCSGAIAVDAVNKSLAATTSPIHAVNKSLAAATSPTFATFIGLAAPASPIFAAFIGRAAPTSPFSPRSSAVQRLHRRF